MLDRSTKAERPEKRGSGARQAIRRALAGPFQLWCVVLMALGIRLVFCLAVSPPNTSGDSAYYHYIASNLARANGYTMDGAEPTRIRPPGYPGFMAGVYLLAGPRLMAVACVQAILGALTVLLAYRLTTRVYGPGPALVSAIIVSLYPALVYYDSRILRESLTAFLLASAVLHAVKASSGERNAGDYLISGLLLAGLSMVKPEMIVIAIPVALMLLRRRRPSSLWRPAVLVILPIAMAWIPWTARNYATFGTFSPTTAGIGSVLWFGSRWAETGGDDQTPQARRELKHKTTSLWNSTTEAEADRLFLRKAVRDIVGRPAWFAKMVGRKALYFWKDANGVKKTLPSISPVLAKLTNAYYYTLLALAAAGILLAWRHQRRALPLLWVILTYMVVYALLHVRNRYRVPVLPLVFVLSAGGFWWVCDTIRASIWARSGTRSRCCADARNSSGSR